MAVLSWWPDGYSSPILVVSQVQILFLTVWQNLFALVVPIFGKTSVTEE